MKDLERQYKHFTTQTTSVTNSPAELLAFHIVLFSLKLLEIS